MLLTSLLLLASTQAGCRPGVVGDGGVAVLSADLDGDSVPDEVRLLDREVEIRLHSKPPSTTRFSMGWEKFGGLEVPLEKLPRLRGRRRDEALRFIEDRAFDRTCATADPKTCHGVVLNDLENERFAWLYLLDRPIDKLRHSSIGDVAIADGGVTIQLTLDTLDAPDFVEVQVRVDDGSIKVVERKRP